MWWLRLQVSTFITVAMMHSTLTLKTVLLIIPKRAQCFKNQLIHYEVAITVRAARFVLETTRSWSCLSTKTSMLLKRVANSKINCQFFSKLMLNLKDWCSRHYREQIATNCYFLQSHVDCIDYYPGYALLSQLSLLWDIDNWILAIHNLSLVISKL